MRELDKSKSYDVSNIKEHHWRDINNYLNSDKNFKWSNMSFRSLVACNALGLHWSDNMGWCLSENKGHTDILDLFYTLENVQVDCRELSGKQIKDMCNVYESNGYKIDDAFYKVEKDSYILSCNQAQTKFKQFGFYNNDDFDFISCNKFMELFSKEEKPLNEIKPQHYSKGIDTFKRMEENCTLEERLAFAKGNIDKYTWREKGQDKEDFVKIIKYAEWALKQLNND